MTINMTTTNKITINKNNKLKISYKNFKLTSHSIQRAYERLNITSKDEIKKLAYQAKYKGINLNGVGINNYKDLGLSYEELTNFKRKFRCYTNSNNIYLYKGNVYVFGGKPNINLITIIPLKIDEGNNVK